MSRKEGKITPAQARLLITDNQWRLLFEQTQVQVRQHGEMLQGLLGELKTVRGAAVREAAPVGSINIPISVSKYC